MGPVGQFVHIGHLNDAALPKRRPVQRHGTAQVGGVRRSGPRSGLRTANFPQQIGLANCQGFAADLHHAMRVFKTFDVRDHHAGVRVIQVPIDHIQRGGGGFIAGGLVVLKTQPLRVGQHHHGIAPGTALGCHADRAFEVGKTVRRAKTQAEAFAHADHPLAVGPNQGDAVLARQADQFGLRGFTARAHFRKSGGDQDDMGDAFATAVSQLRSNLISGDRDQGYIRHLRQRSHVWVTRPVQHPFITWIHRVDLPVEPHVFQMQ